MGIDLISNIYPHSGMKKETLVYLIKRDLKRITEDVRLRTFLKFLIFPKGSTFPFVFWMRVTQWAKKNPFTKYTIGIIVYSIYNHLSIKHGIHVNENINIGPGFKIVHSNCVYINCSFIGENFTIYQGCTLGSQNSDNGRKNIPWVGDNVTIYTGAVVTGKITVGNNSVIGANSYVNKDVLESTFVAGVPAKMIKRV